MIKTASDVVKLLLASKSIQDVFPDLAKYKEVYKSYAVLIHPDLCKDKGCIEAMSILNKYKNELEIGTRFKSDGVSYKYSGNKITIEAEDKIVKVIARNYNALMGLKDEKSKHFQQYIPKSMKVSPDSIEFMLDKRAIPLHSLGTQPQIHVNWILSRMLEFSAWMNQTHNVNAGINPDSMFIIPENHGLICIGFLHLTPISHKLTTLSGKFSSFYPAEIFKHKQATSNIDIELSKRTAVWLLGDKSGVGNQLRKTHDQDIINFLQKSSYSPYDTYTEWRNLLKKKFESKFHPLNV